MITVMRINIALVTVKIKRLDAGGSDRYHGIFVAVLTD